MNLTLLHRDNQLNEMTAATKQLAVELDRQLASAHCDALLLRYDTGRSLARVVSEEATYGSSAVEQLAVYLAMSPDRLPHPLISESVIQHAIQIASLADSAMTDAIAVSKLPRSSAIWFTRLFAFSIIAPQIGTEPVHRQHCRTCGSQILP